MKTSHSKRIFGGLSLGLLPMLANAHSMAIHTADWAGGFLHPLQGMDHIVAMVAVGFWAAYGARNYWLLPLTFVAVMGLGGWLAILGYQVSGVEALVLLSAVALTVLAVKNICFSMKINSLIVAFFAFFHGLAHGYEVAGSADFGPYSLGFVTATLLLHGLGILLAVVMQTLKRMPV